MGAITTADKLAEVRKELGYRRGVYARLVTEGRMTQGEAERRIAVMEAIQANYEALALSEQQQGEMFGEGGAVRVHIVTPEECETADVVVCAPKDTWTPFPDNEEGECSVCGHPIIFRPHAPKRPPKVCLECALAHAEAMGATKQ